jgi:prepilin-type N-terminal cleavage/methylation domain-containing protein
MKIFRYPLRGTAFTLVELLVVVAILGLLIALTIPALAKTIEGAQSVQSMSNLRQLVTANLSYAAENGAYCPADNRANTMRWCAKKVGTKWDPTQGYLSDYLGKSRRVTTCPLFKDMVKGSQSFEEGTGGYGYNSSYLGGRPDLSGTAAYSPAPDRVRIPALSTEIHRANTVMFTTSAYANGSSVQEYPYCEPPYWPATSDRPTPSVHFRFNGKALVGWCDGRVTAESCDPREVGFNPHGGDADAQRLGWFGPDEENGFWNPKRGENEP